MRVDTSEEHGSRISLDETDSEKTLRIMKSLRRAWHQDIKEFTPEHSQAYTRTLQALDILELKLDAEELAAWKKWSSS